MTTPARLADRISTIANSLDLSGFTPFFAPLMFCLNENLWSPMTLVVALVGILLIAHVIAGSRRGTIRLVGTAL
jgi:hypothetical protein